MEILECEYIDGYYDSKKWSEQKKELLIRYSKKYTSYEITIKRVKTDTKGLRCYEVWGKRK